jgi:hypothetical protein
MARITFESKTIEKLKSTSSQLNIKGKSISDIIDKLCEKALELSDNVKRLSFISKKNTLKDLSMELYYLDKRLIKKDIVLFEILKESYNNRTVFLRTIIKRLSWQKPCKTQEAQNIIRDLVKQGLISLIKSCPECGISFYFLPDKCENCGHIFILQKENFQDKRLRPRYAIEITEKGKIFVNELINAYIYIYAFFNKWNKYYL